MQTQSQLSGQTSQMISGQVSGPSQNMTSLSSRGGNRRSWHTESDVETRRMIAEKILLLFEKRKPRVSPEVQQRLPEMVKRFEELLYHDASSKEEYADISTLEQRLMKQGQMRNNHAAAVRGANNSSSSMIPTSGMPSSLNGSTMIPTPGSMNIRGLGHMVPPTTTSNLQGQGLTPMTNPTNMVPTPGLSSTMLASSESSTVNAGSSTMMSGSVQLQQLQYDPRSSGFVNRSVNSQFGGNTAYSMQRKYPYINGNMTNGPLNFPNPPMYAAPHFGNGPQRMNQHRQQHIHIPSQRPLHLTANSAESTPSGTFYNSMSKSSDNLNIQAKEFQASRMIPVPGLPSQQLDMQVQKQIHQIPSQTDKSLGTESQKRTMNTGRNQLQTESNNSRILHQVADEKEPVLGSATCSNSSQQSLPDQEKPGRSKFLAQQLLAVPSDHMDAGKNEPSQENCEGYLDKQSDAEKRMQQISSDYLPENHQGTKQQLDHEWQKSGSQQTIKVNGNESLQKCEPTKELNRSSHDAGSGISRSQVGNTTESMAEKPSPSGGLDPQRAQQYLKQQRWLLFLRHASKCSAHEGQCRSTPHCHAFKQLWMHIAKCSDRDCQYARCQISRTLVRHHYNCRDAHCPVCAPVRHKIAMQQMQASETSCATTVASTTSSTQSSCMPPISSVVVNVDKSFNKPVVMASNSIGDVQMPPAKKAKLEPVEVSIPKIESKQEPSPSIDTTKVETQETATIVETNGPATSILKKEVLSSLTDLVGGRRNQAKSEQGVEDFSIKQDPSNINFDKVANHIKQEIQHEKVVSPVADISNTAKGGKPKIKGVSLTELFTPEQIKEHIVGLRQWVGQSKAKAEKNQAMEHKMSDSSCQLCAVETLTFEPPPIYCTPCGVRIKRNAVYWTMQIGETRHYICVPCYNDPRADTVDIDGINHSKSKLEKRKNDEETDEPWVQCDKCEKWQHQVCALFNMRRNEGGQAEYTCPHCLIGEIQRGERKPLPQSAVLGAKDLPRTLLSDHIEQRLFRKLKQERHERARTQGKSFDEVPGADSLVIRIVSSVDKKLEVKQRFLEMFQYKDYPTEFPYKSKVLLLFQKIEGVEVCLFGMYVQEFGAEAAQPNQRRVYLSYLDSVKYFRPDVKTVNGEALRTFVYHEILIGYLDYCKKRGFTSCYIWACPPLKGEDYILYCHPEIQKTPKSDKLREWYLSMLHKASNENIVVELTNMYDHFFVCTGERKAKVTAACLPYFDGDYWPGAAEDMIMQLQQEEEVGEKQQKRGKTKKTATKRAAKAPAISDLGNNSSKDLQLMQKLGATIYPMKEDFIMVHLQFCCTHCCNFILSGRRWVCKQCQTFHLCDRCYDAEQKRDERDKHPTNSKEAHLLFPVDLAEPLNDTKDKDEIMESEFFDTRQAFLSLCQGNHYQYDTLRRAKHSSMMVLYHLHNPTAPAFVTTCNMCHRDIETGQGWRCETCPDFDLCNSCYSKDVSMKHPHKLSPHPSAADREIQSKEARQQRVLQLRKMLDLLVHASQCGSPHCLYPNCRRVKGLFRHGFACKVRASGGCHLCKKMWYLLQLHARACKESECRVPRCKDLKEHLRRLQHQMESRRRAAVNEMMRQRTAETAAGTH